MTDPAVILATALASVLAIAMLTAAALKGWSGWLELQRAQLDRGRDGPPSPVGSRIELADLKERVRKLEAIAAGVDL